MPLSLQKRVALVPALLFALWLLTDNETSNSENSHHLAVITALNRHRPCLRVYRSLLELNLLLWGTVASIALWSRTIGKKMLTHLLFQPAVEPADPKDDESMNQGRYLPVNADEIFAESEDDSEAANGKEEERDKRFSERGYPDAQIDGDGDIGLTSPHSVASPEMPSAERIAVIAVDSLILILLSLFLFTLSSAEGGTYVDGMSRISTFKFVALIAAPIFPLLLFIGFAIYIVLPWKRRKGFWQIISFTIGAPAYHVTFRDGFIGDIITSSVRPMQDTAFTLFYIFSGLRGWWKQAYDLDAADQPLEKNWILHTVILPMCMVSPLWWRFLQNLRQSFESRKRWPYLGNALKYFFAAQVAVFGLFHPTWKKSFWWLSSFVLATLYQVWWDVFMDWELFVIDGTRIRLRETRIYSVGWMYWSIFVINFLLRFCWTLSFLPPHYLNQAGMLSATFGGDMSQILDPIIATAEIIRRTLWGFLRVELEAIKVGRKNPTLKGAWSDRQQIRDIELKVMAMEGLDVGMLPKPTSDGWISREMYMMNDYQVIGEMCIYATVFSGLGLLAAAHRVTL